MIYLTSDEIYEQWLIWRDSGPSNETRTIPDKLALQFQLLAQRILTKDKYRLYDPQLKQDLVQNAIIKCCKNIKNVDESKRKSLFAYFTRCVECSYMTDLANHYKYLNRKRSMIQNAIQDLQTIMPRKINTQNYDRK